SSAPVEGLADSRGETPLHAGMGAPSHHHLDGDVRRASRAAEESLEEKARTAVPPRVWEGLDEAAGRVDEAPGKPAQGLHGPSGQERRIPGEQLVGAIAAEGNGPRLPGVVGEVDGG